MNICAEYGAAYNGLFDGEFYIIYQQKQDSIYKDYIAGFWRNPKL